MSQTFHESNITWTFNVGCDVLEYDKSSWYRKHFIKCEGSAAVDFVAVQNNVAWLIEVKDFTMSPPAKDKDPLWQIITRKVLGTLSGLLAGSLNAGSASEKKLFREAVRASRIRVVFHCERPKHKTRLFQSLPDLADLQHKLRQKLRAVDVHASVVDCSRSIQNAPWTATWAAQESTS